MRIHQPQLILPFLITTLGVAPIGLAADWHVAPGGLDGAAGSEGEPLETVAHAVQRAANGDRILLQRGGTYQAGGLAAGSGLTITAYGQGEDPILTASREVSLPDTWAQNPAVRTGPVADRVLACYVDGRFVPMARYPNEGFLRVDNDDDPDRIVDAELANRPGVTAGRWTGAQVRWRRWSWWWETRPITAHSAVDTLELGPEGRFDALNSDPGSGYFIDGDLDELDAPGEWHWEGGTLYLYPPDWADPASMRVEVVTGVDDGVSTSGTDFSHVQFQRFWGPALQIGQPATVEDCTFEQIETDAIRFTWNAQPFTVRRSVFRDVRNIAITGWADAAGPAGSLIERNLFLRIGVQRGYGGSGSWHAAGIILGNANAAVFRLNRVVDTGYAGIILGSDGQTVERNVFVRTMGSLNDGAAVYTNCNASIIRENIILDTLGDMETSHPWWPLGHGVWPEFLSDFRDTVIENNSISGSNGFGIFLPNNFSCDLTGNNLVDNRRAGLSLSGDAGDNQDHTIAGNTLAAVAPTRRLVRPENLSQWWLPPYGEPTPVALEYDPALDYGSMTATTFIASAADADVIRPEGQDDIDSLGAWTAEAAWADAAGSSVVRANAILVFNDTESSAAVAVPAGTWTLSDGSPVGATVDLSAFRSVVLISADAVQTDPPYVAASGIDWRSDTPTNSVLTPEPELSVTRDGRVIADGGEDAVGQTSIEPIALTYTISNEGGAGLDIGVPVTLANQTNCSASVQVQPASSLAPGSSAGLTIQVTPDSAGEWSFGVSFTSGDQDEDPMDWTVRGTAADEQDGGVDAGVDGGADGGQDGGGGTDAGLDGTDEPAGGDDPVAGGDGLERIDGGCGCAGGSAAGHLWLLFVLPMLWRSRWR